MYIHIKPWGAAIPSTMSYPLNLWIDPHSSVIALNSDMGLAFNFTASGVNNTAVNTNNPPQTLQVCSKVVPPTGIYGCINPTNTNVPSTASLVIQFASNNAAFLTAFAASYTKMSSIGYGTKLPSLTSINLSTC